jgi:hypothetical protein
MTKKGLLIIGLIIFIGCNNNVKYNYDFDVLSYSYYNMFDTSFSFRINKQDTLFVKQDCRGYNSDFFTIINSSDKEVLKQLIGNIDLLKIDTLYDEHCEDGESIRFSIKTNQFEKSIKAHGDMPPATKELKIKMLEFKRYLQKKSIKCNVAKTTN